MNLLSTIEYATAAVLLIAGVYYVAQVLLARFYGEKLDTGAGETQAGEHSPK